MRRTGTWFSVGLMVCSCVSLAYAAETSEQDRRVEEGKRDALQISEPAPAAAPLTTPGQAQPPAPTGALPVYFLQLNQRYVTHHYDLAKAAVVLRGQDAHYINLESQTNFLKQTGLLPAYWQRRFDPNAPLRKGLFALVLARTLQIRGGLTFHLLPASRRYALKELVYEGLLSPGQVNDLVSGQEFVATLARASDYLVRHRAPVTGTGSAP